jgi:predicted phosphodiesterase
MTPSRQLISDQSLPEDQVPHHLTVAVLSDLHAYDNEDPDNAPSHYCIRDSSNDPTKNPIVGLKDYITKNSLSADLLLCPGDIADKANPLAIKQAWSAIHEIGQSLNAQHIIATSGNHDVDSRHSYNDFDAKGFLQSLEPPYPFSDENLNDRYWSRHFVIIPELSHRLLVLNSSAFHGEGQYDQTKQYEFEHGRISPRTLTAIKQELDRSTAAPVNILLCHHHPHPHSELRLGENDIMTGGQELLQILGSGLYGNWIVIHGHKHHPKLVNAAGGASAPVVFAAGSLCASLYREIQTQARNQFYVLVFPSSQYKQLGFVGQFKAWDWAVGCGWLPAAERSGLPATGGFGWRGALSSLAREILDVVADSTTTMTWDAIKATLPSVEYLLPQDIDTLRTILKRDFSMRVIPDAGVPLEIGKSV